MSSWSFTSFFSVNSKFSQTVATRTSHLFWQMKQRRLDHWWQTWKKISYKKIEIFFAKQCVIENIGGNLFLVFLICILYIVRAERSNNSTPIYCNAKGFQGLRVYQSAVRKLNTNKHNYLFHIFLFSLLLI